MCFTCLFDRQEKLRLETESHAVDVKSKRQQTAAEVEQERARRVHEHDFLQQALDMSSTLQREAERQHVVEQTEQERARCWASSSSSSSTYSFFFFFFFF